MKKIIKLLSLPKLYFLALWLTMSNFNANAQNAQNQLNILYYLFGDSGVTNTCSQSNPITTVCQGSSFSFGVAYQHLYYSNTDFRLKITAPSGTISYTGYIANYAGTLSNTQYGASDSYATINYTFNIPGTYIIDVFAYGPLNGSVTPMSLTVVNGSSFTLPNVTSCQTIQCIQFNSSVL